MCQVAGRAEKHRMETLETINPFTLAPWVERVQGDGQELPETQTRNGASHADYGQQFGAEW